MTNTMLSKPPAVASPLHAPNMSVTPSMEVRMSRLGACLGRLLDQLDERTSVIRGKIAKQTDIFITKCRAAWSELQPALIRAFKEIAAGLRKAADRWQNPAA